MLTLEQPKATTREKLITSWYLEVFPVFARHVKKHHGDLAAAKEVFQEAIICYYEKTMSGKFTPHVSDQAYLMGIARRLWMKHQQALQKTVALDGMDIASPAADPQPAHQLLAYLRLSGARCMDLLQAFYYDKLNMKEVAARFGFASERSATVQKFKCLEKVRDEIKNKSLHYEDFLD